MLQHLRRDREPPLIESGLKPPEAKFSDHFMSLTTTTVLGKRKKGATSESLLLQLSASESNHERSDVSWQEPESEVESPQTLLNSKQKSEFVLVNGSLVKNAKKKYHCTFSSCDKLYSKPCRLEEHERSHTGEVGLLFSIFAVDLWRLAERLLIAAAVRVHDLR